MSDYTAIPTDDIIEKTVSALKENGIEAVVVNTKEEAKEKFLSLLPKGAEIMNMTSVTLEETGILDALKTSGEYHMVKDEIAKLDKNTQARTRRELGAAPDYAIGSVHAITQDGHVLIASQSGSQLPAYANGAGFVLWVAGVQKIVAHTDEGIKRIYEYCLPKESVRANKAYNTTEGSSVNKLLVINKENKQGRLHLILVKEKVGF